MAKSKEVISMRESMSVLIMFLFGSSVVMGANKHAAQDAWISVLLSLLIFLPVGLIYARIMRLYPEKNLFDILEELYGKIAGKVIVAMVTWYAIHLGAIVLRNFSEFIQIVTMTETPQLPIMISMVLTTIYMAKSGIETMSKWAFCVVPIVTITMVSTIILGLGKMDIANLMPVMEHSLKSISYGAFEVFSYPLAETVIFLGVCCSVRSNDSPYKIYLGGAALGTLLLVLVVLRNLLVLGPAMVETTYFPSYSMARIIHVGDFLMRMEGGISMNFVLAGIVKITLCLMTATKGLSKIFSIRDYKQIVIPVGLLVLALCTILYSNAVEMFDFIKFYPYYALPFQVIIPVTVWITAEVKHALKGKKGKKEAPAS